MRQVSCPSCGNPAGFVPENKWRPFCCERCKLIDLGSWAAEEYRVAVPEQQLEPDDPGDGSVCQSPPARQRN